MPLEGEARLGELRLGRREVGLRRAQRVLLDLGVEPGDDLARREHIADIDGPLGHAPVKAKGEADMVLGAEPGRSARRSPLPRRAPR